MKPSLLIAVVFSIAVMLGMHASATAQGREYIGYKYKGVAPETVLPNGVKHLGGGLISDPNKEPVYGISSVVKGAKKMVWLEISTGSDRTGITGWQVKDVLVFSKRDRRYLMFGLDPSVQCRRKGKYLEKLVAIGHILPKKGVFRPDLAWVADIAKQKFVEVPVRSLQCEYSEP